MSRSDPPLRTTAAPARRATGHAGDAAGHTRAFAKPRTTVGRIVGNSLGWFVLFTVAGIGIAGLMSMGLDLGDVWIWLTHMLATAT